MEISKLQLGWTVIWAGLHTVQYGLAITSLNGIQDAVTCSSGSDIGMHSIDKPFLSPCVAMTPAQFGLVVSIFTIGGLFGSFSSDFITRKIGRIGTFRTSSCFVMVGSALVGLSNSMVFMMIGRVLIGLGTGLATVSVPLFLAEIAPPSLKKSLGIMTQLFIVIGMLIGQSLSFPFAKPTQWRFVFVAAIALAGIQIAGSWFASNPETAKTAAPRAAGGDEEAPLLGDEPQKAMSIRELFGSHDPKIRTGLIVVLITQIAQQICGISPVMYFSTRILKPVFNGNSKMIVLLVILFKIPLTILPAFIIQRLGSRRILLFSSFVMAFAALLLAFGLNKDSAPASAIAIVSFVAAFSVGLGPVTWVVMSEVMPRHATTAAGSMGLACNWTLNFIMGSSFLPLQDLLSGGKESGEGNIFFVFATTCALVFIATRLSYAAYDRVHQ